MAALNKKATAAAQPYLAPTLADLGKVHFIGIGGAGMSAVARILLGRGIPVAGSDLRDSAALAELGALGATIHVGQQASHVADADTVVVSTAIRDSNVELQAARRLGRRVLHRSQALAAAMAGDRVVAVAGTHGKTTTTSMATVMLKSAGVDASFAVGGTVQGLGVNAGHGTAAVFVAEADESDASFLNYRPHVAVVTNLEADHLDHYGTADAVVAAFEQFVGLLTPDGTLVACADDPGSNALAAKAAAAGTRCLLYGFAEHAHIRLLPGSHEGLHTTAGVRILPPGVPEAKARTFELRLQVPGNHNLSNAAAAVGVALALDVDLPAALAALAGFSGAARRFEFKGQAKAVSVYDDYAHHPTEVTAALKAARTVAGSHQVHVLFQPHLFSRTREFAQEFATALDLADTVAVVDIYPAREDPIPGVSSELITRSLRALPGYIPASGDAVKQLAAQAKPGDIILTVGAGDVTELGAQLLAALQSGAAEADADG